jgi:hypothetical protein
MTAPDVCRTDEINFGFGSRQQAFVHSRSSSGAENGSAMPVNPADMA